MVNNNSATNTGGKSDPSASGGASVDEKAMPKDGRVMVSILKDMGVMDFEPRVVNQLLEFSYRYISTVLEDSKVLSSHARKKAVDIDDVKLAVQLHTDHNLTSPPPRDLLLEVAAKRNAIPLPIPKQSGGLRLPPDRYCLTATNYRLKPNKKRGPGAKSHTVGGGYGGSYSINSMNSIPQAVKSQANSAGKIALTVGSVGGGTTPTFTVKQLPSKVGTSNIMSTSGTPTPAAFIKINHANPTTAAAAASNQTSTQLNTAAKIQIQPGLASSGVPPMFSMTVNPPLLNSNAAQATTTGVKRKADQMENHTN